MCVYVADLCVFTYAGSKMKVVAAYLLAVLGGNTCPTAEDLKNILGSGTFCSCLCVCICACMCDCFVIDN